MKKELTCIGCPMGCALSVELSENGEFLSAQGYSCNIGKKYAEEECTHPTRMVTSLMRVKGTNMPLSVKTDKPIDKEKIFDCLRQIRDQQAERPVHIGDILLEHVCDTPCNIIATKTIK